MYQQALLMLCEIEFHILSIVSINVIWSERLKNEFSDGIFNALIQKPIFTFLRGKCEIDG